MPTPRYMTAPTAGPMDMAASITNEFIDINAPRNATGAELTINVCTAGRTNPWANPSIITGATNQPSDGAITNPANPTAYPTNPTVVSQLIPSRSDSGLSRAAVTAATPDANEK